MGIVRPESHNLTFRPVCCAAGGAKQRAAAISGRRNDRLGAQRLNLYNVTRKRPLAGTVHRPTAWWPRSMGLLVRPPLQPGEALWLQPCGGIHTWGMQVTIDVVFLGAGLEVLGCYVEVPPWRMRFAPRGTRSVVELPAGAAAWVQVGDRLEARANSQ
jgi:uncharacterized membrane protein (UPF0127 family)